MRQTAATTADATEDDKGPSMRELRLVAVSTDGQHLLVGIEDPDGEKFQLEIDERLRAAVSRPRPGPGRPGMPASRPESALTPREIQARLRAGESADDVARTAGVPVDRITRFEGPVVAERELRIAEARAATPHRAAGSPHEAMGELADAFLERERIDADSARWDAWLDADGTWRVELRYAVAGRARSARWSWDVVRYHLAPLDKAAGIIAEPPPDPSPLPHPARAQPEPSALPDPWAVGDEVVDDEVVDDEVVDDEVVDASPPGTQPPGSGQPGPAASAPLSVEEELSELGRLAVAVEAVSLPADAAATETDGTEANPTDQQPTGQPAAEDGPAPADPGSAPAPAAARASRRASVPSWDDILLGTRPQK
jgi:Protein of unknown function (DUF3071)